MSTPEPATGIEALVCEDIRARQQMGRQKYGTTVADNPLDLLAWVRHAYGEALDLSVYLRRIAADLEVSTVPAKCGACSLVFTITCAQSEPPLVMRFCPVCGERSLHWHHKEDQP